jgi:hypothetical protein
MMFELATKASFSFSSFLASSLLLSVSLQVAQAIPIPVRSRDTSLEGTSSDINTREPGPVQVSVDFGGEAGYGVNVTVWNTTITSTPPAPPANIAPPSPQSSSEPSPPAANSPSAADSPSPDVLGDDGADNLGDGSTDGGLTNGDLTNNSDDAPESRREEPSALYRNVARQDDAGDSGDTGDIGGNTDDTEDPSGDGEPQPKDANGTFGRLINDYQLLQAATFAGSYPSFLYGVTGNEIICSHST